MKGGDVPGNKEDIPLQPAEMPTQKIYPKRAAAHEEDPCWKRGEV